jgi:uncharacterized protein involved in response to NO
MIYGFGFAFVTGFLGTAWPKFLESSKLRRTELALLVVAWMVTQTLCWRNQIRIADAAFAVNALILFGILALRLQNREDNPPAGFILAFGTVFAGACAGITWAFWLPSELPTWLFLFTKIFLWQGLLLLPLLGVGSYLFPRFFRVPGKQPSPVPHQSTGVWLAAIMVVGSIGIEAAGWIKIGNLLRFAAIVGWAILAVPVLWKGKATSTRAWALRIAIGSIALSFLIRSFWPGPAYALEHLLFISGFGLSMLLVADRVTLGHSDVLDKLPAKSTLWRWIVWIILVAAATRVSADMKASILVSHHIYAAILWAAVAILFFANLRRFWWRAPEDE